MERLVKTGLMMAYHVLFLMEFNMIMCLMIDIGDGEPVRKLPYNRSDNPYDVAEKMATQREVNKLWNSFILQNTGQKQFTPDPSFCDPYTGSCAYTLVNLQSQLKGMLVFDAAQFDGILKKVSEFNTTLLSSRESLSHS